MIAWTVLTLITLTATSPIIFVALHPMEDK